MYRIRRKYIYTVRKINDGVYRYVSDPSGPWYLPSSYELRKFHVGIDSFWNISIWLLDFIYLPMKRRSDAAPREYFDKMVAQVYVERDYNHRNREWYQRWRAINHD